MKITTLILLPAFCLLLSCNTKTAADDSAIHLNGTWKLVAGNTITKGVSSTTEYPKDQQMVKIINDTHFAFLNHRVNTTKDSTNHFDAGGGSYTLKGNQYTEHLDYYSDKNWEGKAFTFTITLKGDTLIQKGLEKVENENIDRIIIEKYIRMK
jgi:hypothetical protein